MQCNIAGIKLTKILQLEYQTQLDEFALEMIDLIDKHKEFLPPYEIVNRMIANAVSIALCCAPNELVGVKTIMASIENGINEYEETHS